jgi:hypothetical protein
MLSLNYVKRFMMHPSARVRKFAGEYFANANYQPPGLVDKVFAAVDALGEDECVELLVAARAYEWTRPHWDRALDGLIRASRTSADGMLQGAGRQYSFLLLQAPPDFLLDHQDELLSQCRFSTAQRQALTAFFALPKVTPETLYEQILRSACDPEAAIGYNNVPFERGRFMARQLAHLADPETVKRVLRLCAAPDTADSFLAYFMSEVLKGKQRVDLRPLVKHLAAPAEPGNDAFLFAIRGTADPALAKYMIAKATKAQRGNAPFVRRVLEALDTVKDKCVCEFCQDMLRTSRSLEDRAYAYACLARMADRSSLPILERGAQREDYDVGFLDLESNLLILSVLFDGDIGGESAPSRRLREIDRRDRAQAQRAEILARQLGFS